MGKGLREFIYGKMLNLAFVRFVHALHFLEGHRGTYHNVLLTDVRDVFFQDDPFRETLPGEIAAFMESPRMTFGSEPLNDGWIMGNYGKDMSDQLRGRRISCCGTVAGTESGMIEYLRAFVSEIARLRSVEHGADTSVHNVLAYEVLSRRIAVLENFKSMVGTINSDEISTEFSQDAHWPVIGPKGLPVPVLHQYDRQSGVAAKLMKNISALDQDQKRRVTV